MLKILTLSISIFNISMAFAIGPSADSFFLDPRFGYTYDTYQIGDEWGKKPVRKNLYRKYAIPESSKLAILATAKLKGGTAFYLGKFAGRHLIATNYHVCMLTFQCTGKYADFTEFNGAKTKFKVIRSLGLFVPIDLGLYEIEASENMPPALPFDFNFKIKKGMTLTSTGYGIGGNYERKKQMVIFDDDCVIFSKDQEARLISDPDTINQAYYKAWSIATGCDSSHGDSGSAMLDRKTGVNIGILWTGGFPKSNEAKYSKELSLWRKNNNERIWKELTYVVPAKKIKEYLLRAIKKGEIKDQDLPAIKAMIGLESDNTPSS